MARILVECGNALVAMDRVEALEAAGHDVTTCPGPAHHDCPVLTGKPCHAITDADVVVSCLGDKTLRVTLAAKLVHPDQDIVALLTGTEVNESSEPVDGIVVIPAGSDDAALRTIVDDTLDRRGKP